MSLPARIASIIHNREQSPKNISKVSLNISSVGSVVSAAKVGLIKNIHTITKIPTIFIVLVLVNALMIVVRCIQQ